MLNENQEKHPPVTQKKLLKSWWKILSILLSLTIVMMVNVMVVEGHLQMSVVGYVVISAINGMMLIVRI